MNSNTKPKTAAVKKRPWSERLQQSEQSSVWSDTFCVGLISALRDIPLEEYLRDDPELLRELRGLYSPPPATFGEAAAVIEAVCWSQESERGHRLMYRCAEPIRTA